MKDGVPEIPEFHGNSKDWKDGKDWNTSHFLSFACIVHRFLDYVGPHHRGSGLPFHQEVSIY